jgi:hypothetical protein
MTLHHLSYALLLLALFPFYSLASFVLQVPVKDEHCFVLRVPPNSLVSGNWDALDDHLSPNPITFKILFAENMKHVYQSEFGKSEDIFRIKVESGGRLYACIQNGVDVESQDELDRTVGLEIRVSPLPLEDAPSQKLLSQAEAVQQRLYDLKNHYDYMRTREAVHRATTEETFSLVVRWSILEFVVLVGIAIMQVVVLRLFFERKRYI